MTVSAQTMRNIATVRGDLSGSLLDPQVVGIQGVEIANSPSDGQTPVYNASSDTISWTTVSGGGGSGSVGPQGPAGPSGSQGSQGIQGPSGSQGPQGEAGPQGLQGVKGDTGATGAIGPSGSQGSQGIQGPSGSTGATGATGPQGPSGSQGPQGIQGPSGSTGPQGIQGPSGSAGATGPQGPSGSAGATGATGLQGPAGPSGSQGPKGDTGATGATGPSGSQGPQGIQGPSGSQGPQGATGPQGPSGTPADLSAYATTASLASYLTTASAASTYLAKSDLTSSARSAISAGTNVSINNGQISLVASPTVTDLVVAGNLTVNGTTTAVNSTNLEITDKYILIASGAANAAALHGAGIQFGSVPSEDARIIYDATNDWMQIYPGVSSSAIRGAFIGDGSQITSTPYDIASEASGTITSGSELMNYITPRAFTATAFSQYTGSGAVSAYVMKNGVSASFPVSVSANDLLTVVAKSSGSKAYFTIKGNL